jgi:hypothetical protein
VFDDDRLFFAVPLDREVDGTGQERVAATSANVGVPLPSPAMIQVAGPDVRQLGGVKAGSPAERATPPLPHRKGCGSTLSGVARSS